MLLASSLCVNATGGVTHGQHALTYQLQRVEQPCARDHSCAVLVVVEPAQASKVTTHKMCRYNHPKSARDLLCVNSKNTLAKLLFSGLSSPLTLGCSCDAAPPSQRRSTLAPVVRQTQYTCETCFAAHAMCLQSHSLTQCCPQPHIHLAIQPAEELRHPTPTHTTHLDVFQVDAPKSGLQCHQHVHQLDGVRTVQLNVKSVQV